MKDLKTRKKIFITENLKKLEFYFKNLFREFLSKLFGKSYDSLKPFPIKNEGFYKTTRIRGKVGENVPENIGINNKLRWSI